MTPSKLRKWRKELGYNIKEMSAALECNYYHYFRLEKGERRLTKDKQKLWGRLHDEWRANNDK